MAFYQHYLISIHKEVATEISNQKMSCSIQSQDNWNLSISKSPKWSNIHIKNYKWWPIQEPSSIKHQKCLKVKFIHNLSILGPLVSFAMKWLQVIIHSKIYIKVKLWDKSNKNNLNMILLILQIFVSISWKNALKKIP